MNIGVHYASSVIELLTIRFSKIYQQIVNQVFGKVMALFNHCMDRFSNFRYIPDLELLS